jgi:hypothetical protein
VSIRWRLTLWYGASLAVALAAFGAVVYFVARHQSMERIDWGLSEEAADVLSEIDRAHTDGDLGEWLQRRFGQHEGYDFQITRPGGARYFANQRLADKTLPLPDQGRPSSSPSYRTVSADSGRWRVFTVQAQGPTDKLTVQVARPLDDFDHESTELLLALVLAGPLTLLIAGGGGYWMAGRALAPVNLLRRR